MEEKKKISNKAKGIIAGGVASGIAAIVGVVSVVAVGGPSKDAGPSTYSVSISSELEGFEDTNLTVNSGSKIKDLMSMVSSPVEGFRVEGFYKDLLCTERYDDNDMVTESTKIFVKFEVITYTVKAYASQADTNPQVLEVEHNKAARPSTPSKAADEYGSYKFTGWTNIRGEKVELSNITSDMEIYATFAIKEYNEYTIFDFSENVRITKGVGEEETELSTADSLHYGDRIKIEYSESEGHEKTEFRVEGARLVEGTENWYEVTGDLRVSYAEEKLAFVVGELPPQVNITDNNGNTITAGTQLLYGDVITITYTPTAGYEMSEFEVVGAYPLDGLGFGENKYAVRGNISVTYEEIESPDILYLNYEAYEDGYMVTGLNDNTITDITIPATSTKQKIPKLLGIFLL